MPPTVLRRVPARLSARTNTSPSKGERLGSFDGILLGCKNARFYRRSKTVAKGGGPRRRDADKGI
jgi:hypothetical protein